MTKKAAVFGWWYNQNYGSILTYYALNKYIQDKGYDTILIDGPDGYKNRSKFRTWMPLAYEFFKAQGMAYSNQPTRATMRELNHLEDVDTFILGSDQMWNPWNGWVDWDDFFDWVQPNKKSIAYSVSLGKDDRSKYDPDWVANRRRDISKFDAVSMREAFSVDIMKDIFEEEVPRVLDPTYILDKSYYHDLADKSSHDYAGQAYIATFFLDPNDDKARIAKMIAKKLGYNLMIIPNPLNGLEKAKELFNTDEFDFISEAIPQNFLNAYRNASYIITDSFHGTVFATIFEKPFSVFYNAMRGLARFGAVMDLFEFAEADRRINEEMTDEAILANESINLAVDYATTRDKVQSEIVRSREWLDTALEMPSQVDETEVYDEFRTFLTSRSFDFYRAKTTDALANNIIFSENGTIKNTFDNESYWQLTHKELLIFDKQFQITTKFDRSKFTTENTFSPFRISGAFKDGKTEHVMYVHAPKKKAAPKDKNAVAIPDGLLTRKALIVSIVNNEKIQKWRSDLISNIPNLIFFVGRELKEYANNFVGGPADILTFPTTIDELQKIVKYAKKHDIPLTIIGKGSNILVRDGGIRGITIITTRLNYYRIEDDLLVAGAGADLIETSYYLFEHKRQGLEWADNIPGTIGGAVYMNAGTVRDIRGMFSEATIIDENGEIKVLKADQVVFKHRYSIFMDHPEWTIVEAKLKISAGQTDAMINDMVNTVEIREKMHPLTLPNHGSTFTWGRAPRLIQQAGIVGTQIGGIQISTKHPGFFVNVSQGTAADYEALIYWTISEVYKFSGFLLKPEVRILGTTIWEASVYFK
ncbi:MAG: UDP-N-acetylmuramate dehydrogenase [Lactococcus sp.]|nr:UDP-N-acetylmuramate dehydrogenase [Lactococcus sp.]MDN5409245.1 UDP-N-acetylmuramate dehydrogenase [Lactococcus sp.]MDN5411322.1 UDP-N-acetylmuramate dehydrogenase [Lactococcus sp.]MDN5436572.1 UDP-N-acetylmuramate dehydrogenase [Lactococcus sp.]MDN5461144.1 UDP-N-acetylmuramate dehydrogenase [Lactococcus sp.]MDN5466730.1 UDP-N-acetylmuramate dehydrogenase [Lactococcus sp.]